jgi:hypothetical protein
VAPSRCRCIRPAQLWQHANAPPLPPCHCAAGEGGPPLQPGPGAQLLQQLEQLAGGLGHAAAELAQKAGSQLTHAEAAAAAAAGRALGALQGAAANLSRGALQAERAAELRAQQLLQRARGVVRAAKPGALRAAAPEPPAAAKAGAAAAKAGAAKEMLTGGRDVLAGLGGGAAKAGAAPAPAPQPQPPACPYSDPACCGVQRSLECLAERTGVDPCAAALLGGLGQAGSARAGPGLVLDAPAVPPAARCLAGGGGEAPAPAAAGPGEAGGEGGGGGGRGWRMSREARVRARLEDGQQLLARV